MQKFGTLLPESQLLATERLRKFLDDCLTRTENQERLRRPRGN